MVRKEILNPLNPEKENTTFLGGANGNDIILSDEINYTFSASDFDDYLYVLTAKFEDLFYVTYLTNGGNVIASQYFVDGERLSLPTCEREHYVFTGWDINGRTYQAGSSLIVSQDISAVAQWRAEAYTLIYQYQNGQEIDRQQISYSQNVNLISQPNMEGHYAIGWQIGGSTYISTFVAGDLGDDGDQITATAIYGIESYTISFTGSFNENLESITANYSQNISLPTPTRDGYTFAGWQIGGSLYTGSYQVADLGNNNENVAFTATWQGNEITLSFDYGDGVVQSGKIDSISITVGDIINSGDLPSPVYAEPYTFEGWYLDENFSTAIRYGSTSDLTKDTTLYAKTSQPTDITAFGSGSQEDPYRVYNADQFLALSSAGTTTCPVKTGEYIKLMSNITMPSNYQTPDVNVSVNINIDGNGSTLTINKPIALTFDGTLKNINIQFESEQNIDSQTPRSYIFATNGGTLDNVSITNQTITYNLSTPAFLTPFVYTNNGTITNCTNYADINIVGGRGSLAYFSVFTQLNNNIISNCNNYGDITASAQTFVGVFAYNNSYSISGCTTTGDITVYHIGVIAANHSPKDNYSLIVQNCHVEGNMTIQGSSTQNSILGTLNISGVVKNDNGIVIENCTYSCDNLLVIVIYDNGSSYTDLETIKTLLSNVDFGSITKKFLLN